MRSSIYGLHDTDISQAFKRIDSFLEDNFAELKDENLILNENNIKTIKILLSDLYSLEGLIPNELKQREHLMYKLSSILTMHYTFKTEENGLKIKFFLTPKVENH